MYLAYKLTDKNKLYAVKVEDNVVCCRFNVFFNPIFPSTANEKVGNDQQEHGIPSNHGTKRSSPIKKPILCDIILFVAVIVERIPGNIDD